MRGRTVSDVDRAGPACRRDRAYRRCARCHYGSALDASRRIGFRRLCVLVRRPRLAGWGRSVPGPQRRAPVALPALDAAPSPTVGPDAVERRVAGVADPDDWFSLAQPALGLRAAADSHGARRRGACRTDGHRAGHGQCDCPMRSGPLGRSVLRPAPSGSVLGRGDCRQVVPNRLLADALEEG